MEFLAHDRRVLAALGVVAVLGFTLLASPALSRVTRVDVASREVVSDLPELEATGPYEVLKGTVYFEVDPGDPANEVITDLALAPRNGLGCVEFSSEFELHKPVDPARGNGRLIYFVNNRGSKHGSYCFNRDTGGNWLYEKGWSYMWSGWNADVIESDAKINMTVPFATDGGKPITGKVYTEIVSYSDNVVHSMPLVWGESVPHPVADMNEPGATLSMRQYRWTEPVEIPREGWSFARFEDGQVAPDPGYLYIEEGFRPGWLYDLVYTGRDPRLTGLGLAAIRDVVSFLRYEAADDTGQPNPLAGAIEHTYSWGHSQSGRVLYHFVWQGFNADEKGRIVFDGVIPNCAGAGKGEFNSRWAQTTRHGSHLEDNLYPIDFFPLATVEQYDPLTGERGDALAGARDAGVLPKMMFVNSSSDYWTRAASLLHTDVEGKRDVAIDPNVRIYLESSKAHTDGRMCIVTRALLVVLDEWVTSGIEPPASEIPRISDGTLVTLEAWREAFPEIPGITMPPSFYHPYRLDPGPRWRSQGIADNVPPLTGPRYVCLVPQVDENGHDIAGVRLPEIEVPLATATGWSMRRPSFSNTLRRNAGAGWPLPLTASAREAAGDPRPSIEERYPTPAAYLGPVKECLDDLLRKRLLLKEDHARQLEEARKQAALLGEYRPLEDVAVEEGAEAALALYEKLEDARFEAWHSIYSGNLNSGLNSRGYELMAAGELDKALEVFKLNTLIYKDDGNVWDSLGECYYNMGDLPRALENYEKSLEINPGNEGGRRMIERIKADLGM
jgi:hypothetical protein